MKYFKHYSFDLWFTLIKSNPIFKKERAIYFYKNYNTKKKSLDEVEFIFRKVDLMCNAINEKTGGNIDAEEMYLMVLFELNNDNIFFENVNLIEIGTYLDQLFFNYSPVIFDKNTINVLEVIKQKPNTTLSILSNTAFVKGKILRTLLNNLDISKYFDFQIYSDESKLSKPNPKFFSQMIRAAQGLHSEKILSYNEIIHIGDNIISDIKGANLIGIHSQLINSNNQNIQNIHY